MTYDSYELNFMGYWRATYINSIPNESGVFCVYSCTNNVANNTVALHELLFIGEADQVRDSIYKHEKLGDWLLHLRNNEELCFTFASVEPEKGESVRRQIKSVLVNRFKPKCNSNNNTTLSNTPIQIRTIGANWNIEQEIAICDSSQSESFGNLQMQSS